METKQKTPEEVIKQLVLLEPMLKQANIYHEVIDCMKVYASEENRKKDEAIETPEELGDRLCDHCPLEKKGVYSVPGGYVAGCEGSACKDAYENYLEKKDEPKQSGRYFISGNSLMQSNGNGSSTHCLNFGTIKPNEEFQKILIDGLNQSKLPASIQWLSDDEIGKIFDSITHRTMSIGIFKKAVNNIQSELRKRVIDPVRFLIWCEENDWTLIQAPGGIHEGNFQQRGKYYSTGQQLLQKYVDHLTSKPQSNGN